MAALSIEPAGAGGELAPLILAPPRFAQHSVPAFTPVQLMKQKIRVILTVVDGCTMVFACCVSTESVGAESDVTRG